MQIEENTVSIIHRMILAIVDVNAESTLLFANSSRTASSELLSEQRTLFAREAVHQRDCSPARSLHRKFFLDILRRRTEKNTLHLLQQESEVSEMSEISTPENEKNININNEEESTESVEDSTEKTVDKEGQIFRRPKKSNKRKARTEDAKAEEAFKIMKSLQNNYLNEDDECTAFGKYIGKKLRKYDERTRAIAQSRISNIFLEMDLNLPYNPTVHFSNFGESSQNNSTSTCSTPAPSPA